MLRPELPLGILSSVSVAFGGRVGSSLQPVVYLLTPCQGRIPEYSVKAYVTGILRQEQE
jgi:hypothetical protein